MDYIIKKIEFNMMEEAFSMIMKVFMEFDAPDYSQEGIETFRKDIIQNKDFKNRFKTGEQMMVGAFIDNKIIGVMAISIRNHISLVFVDKEHHRKGIATSLFNEILKKVVDEKVNKITLNSSPYAVPFYFKIGFIATDTQQVKNGIKYIPMEFRL